MWYYSKNGAQLGPIGPAEMQSKLNAGEISPTDLVWREGMADWLPAEKVEELQSLVAPRPPRAEAVASAERPPVSPYATPQPHVAPPLAYTQISQGLAIGSMVCGIVSLLTCCVWFLGGTIAVVAVVLGHRAISRIKAEPGRFGGKGMARAGLITGYIGIVGAALMLAFGLWAQGLTADQIRQWDFLPPESKEEFIRQLEMQQRMKQSRP